VQERLYRCWRLPSVDLTAANDAINAAAHSGLPAAAALESNFARRNAWNNVPTAFAKR
jgi:hypothetical protein